MQLYLPNFTMEKQNWIYIQMGSQKPFWLQFCDYNIIAINFVYTGALFSYAIDYYYSISQNG